MKLEKVRQRLAMGASNMMRPGADLIAWYLNPDRLPWNGGGRVGTLTPSGGCASGLPRRSSEHLPARTSRLSICRRS